MKSRKMIKLNDDQKRRILMLVVLIAIPVVMYIINYEVHTLVLGGYKCPVLHNTGLYCPGCGGRRMLKALLHGRIYQAFRYNPFLFISIPFVIVYYPVNIILFIKNGTETKHFQIISLVFILVALVFMALRNLNMFSFLLPVNIT